MYSSRRCLFGRQGSDGEGWKSPVLLDTRGIREVVNVGEVLKERLW